jgi:hypothetical protein
LWNMSEVVHVCLYNFFIIRQVMVVLILIIILIVPFQLSWSLFGIRISIPTLILVILLRTHLVVHHNLTKKGQNALMHFNKAPALLDHDDPGRLMLDQGFGDLALAQMHSLIALELVEDPDFHRDHKPVISDEVRELHMGLMLHQLYID